MKKVHLIFYVFLAVALVTVLMIWDPTESALQMMTTKLISMTVAIIIMTMFRGLLANKTFITWIVNLFMKATSRIQLDRLISAASFLLPHDYAEAFRGDLLEKKQDMLRAGHTKGYIWFAIIANIAYAYWAALWFKLKDIIDPSEKKEIDK